MTLRTIFTFIVMAGCQAPPQTVVVLDADEASIALATHLRVRVCGADGAVAEDRREPLAALSFPTRVPVSPRGGDDRRTFALEAILDQGGLTLQAQRVFAGFPSEGIREVDRAFSAACANIRCAENETCAAGACIAAGDTDLTAGDAATRLACCVPSGNETCDGTDEDCDGRIDEGDGIPSVCVAMGRTRVRDQCDDGSSPWNGAGGERSRLNRVQLNLPNLELTGAFMFLDGDGDPGTTQAHRVLIYDDDGTDPDGSPGAPGTLLAVSEEVVVPAEEEPGWVFFFGWERAPPVLEPKPYWIGSFGSGPAGGTTLYNGCVVAAGDGRLGEDRYVDGAADPFSPRPDSQGGSVFTREITLFIVHAP
ncbi:MAG: hypothetical protein AAGF12_24255 [Myxococcota bacterium]